MLLILTNYNYTFRQNLFKSPIDSKVHQKLQPLRQIPGENITIIIAISPNKCGSKYIYKMLKDTLQQFYWHFKGKPDPNS